MDDTPFPRHIALVGMMGSGKSTVGRRVATRLGRPFVDTDTIVEAQTGRSVAQIFADDGEDAFRGRESQVLREVLEAPEPAVISTGGGVVVVPENRRLLHERAVTVWLRASPGVLAGRVKDDGSRPLLADDPRAALRALATDREELYLETATQVVEVDHVDRKTVVQRVLDVLETEGITR